ncbi:M16 family metallopeptidase [Maribacter sp. 2210JD10-5]|uniref:M16 family metallopeptidase n=1 Tax=Maribacter sp. 2210JD10-5 TaxID=3386272 RepID=UPI0039BD2FF8
MTIKKIAFLASCLLFSLLLKAQITTTIPLPEKVRHGKLENGMTYFIMHNEEPKNRVSFYFAQRVGAILEEDDEDGLAHFLEHMAFNGSENFPGRSVDQYLESKGLIFGRDFNAYTDVDETLYNIDNVPVKDAELIDKSLLILHDWSGSLSLIGKDIDEERGVIEEEWRSSRNAQMRMYEKTMPVMFAGSKYAERDIIGDQKFIQTFDHESLRNYYKKWYRPDLQAVIVVGDIDVDQMEEKIKKQFSKILLVENAIERPYYDIPDNKEIGYVLATDKDAATIQVNWLFKRDSEKVKNEAYLRTSLVERLFGTMMANRYTEIIQDPESSAIAIAADVTDLALSTKIQYIGISPKPDKVNEAIKTAYTEIERVRQHGFLPSEFERAKSELLAEKELAVEEEKRKENGDWSYDIARYYFDASPLIPASEDLKLHQKLVSEIDLKEVEDLTERYNEISNSIVTINGPQDDDIKYPTKEEFTTLIDEVKKRKIAAYEDVISDRPLISEELTEKPIKKTFTLDKIEDAKGFELANGAKVIMMPSKKKSNNVVLQAMSFGGLSKLRTKNLKSAYFIDQLMAISGLGDFNRVALEKKTAGKTAEVYMSLNDYTEMVEGKSSFKDLELMLQLVYLHFERPNFDKALFNAQKPVLRDYVERLRKNEDMIFYDSINKKTFDNHPRVQPLVAEDVDLLDTKVLEQIYKQRFSDADDFVFVITGNFDHNKVLPLLQKYIGNIKSLPTTELWADNNMRPKQGESAAKFSKAMENPQSSIFYSKTFTAPYSLENRLMAKILQAVLDTRYVDTVREEQGGSYGVSVTADMERIPEERLSIDIQFNCNPAKSDELLQVVKNELENLVSKGPKPEYVEKAKKNLINDREVQVNDDDFWRQQIFDVLLYEDRYVSLEEFKKAVNNISAKKLHRFVKEAFPEASSIEVVMNPKIK